MPHIHARAFCRSYGLELAKMETDVELNRVRSFLINNQNSIPANFILVDGYTPTAKSTDNWYFTTTGVKIPLSIPWAAGEPNGANENCLSMGPKGTYNFNDVECNGHEYPVLCEKRNH